MKKNILLLILVIVAASLSVGCYMYYPSYNHYIVTYNYNYTETGKTSPTEINYRVREGRSTPNLPATREGYNFEGWYTDQECTSAFNFSTPIKEEITLYAKWKLAETGSSNVLSTAGRPDNNCDWVQLWKDGPRFAKFNVGSTIDDYSSKTDYTTANVGGLYTWGGKIDLRSNAYSDDHNTGNTDLTFEGNTPTDTATILWGSNWRMPTNKEICNLCNREDTRGDDLETPLTKWEWCDGIKHTAEGDGHLQYAEGCTLIGYKVSGIQEGYTDKSIFLPASGYHNATELKEVGESGTFYSSTISSDYPDSIRTISYYLNDLYYNLFTSTNCRDAGYTVLAVFVE